MPKVTNAHCRHFAWIVLFASVVRGGVLLSAHESLTADPDAYREIARCVALYGVIGIEGVDQSSGKRTGFPTAFRPPLYPWLLAWLPNDQGNPTNDAVALMHGLLGILTVAGTYIVALQLLSNPQADRVPRQLNMAAALAAVLVAIDPLLLKSSSLVMTETLAAMLVVLTLWCWLRLLSVLDRDRAEPPLRVFACAGLIGVVLGLAYLCRPTFILWPLLLGAHLVGSAIYQRRGQDAIAAGCMVLTVAILVAAWSARNFHHYQKPIWATTHGGYTLLLGNNPSFYDYLKTPGTFGRAWDPSFFFASWAQRSSGDPRDAAFWERDHAIQQPHVKPATNGEVADDRLAYETAIATIQRDPLRFLHACLWRLERLHSPLPLRTGDRSSGAIIGITAFYSLVLVLVLTGIWKLGLRLASPRWIAALALWVSLACVHTVYWTDMRMRAPAVPVWSILAAAALLPRTRPAASAGGHTAALRSTIPASNS